jgi:NAD-dependent deacetylase
VIEIHGDALATRCLSCGAPGRLDPETLQGLEATPACDGCGGSLRPDVVLFGERLPAEAVRRLERDFCLEPPDLVLVAGTTAQFPYVAEPVVLAARNGRLTVEVNPGTSEVSSFVRWRFAAPAGEILPRLADALAGPLGPGAPAPGAAPERRA